MFRGSDFDTFIIRNKLLNSYPIANKRNKTQRDKVNSILEFDPTSV